MKVMTERLICYFSRELLPSVEAQKQFQEKAVLFLKSAIIAVCIRKPDKYSNLKLPHKLPPKREPMVVSSLPMLGYLEQTVAVAITKAMTAVGTVKPKYPFLSASKSALIYVAFHLKGVCVCAPY